MHSDEMADSLNAEGDPHSEAAGETANGTPLNSSNRSPPRKYPLSPKLLHGSNLTAIRCNNCLGAGHIKRNCPQIRCNNCGISGHFKQDCPATKRSRGEEQLEAVNTVPSDVCYRCGSSRHLQASCPVPLLVECRTCHQEGHVMTICPQTRCFNCGSMGHSAQICQSRTHCFHCSIQGHRSSECPIKNRGKVCYQCKEPGHEASQCPLGLVCRMCHQQGHVVARCPSVVCNSCHQKGHMAGDCHSTTAPAPVPVAMHGAATAAPWYYYVGGESHVDPSHPRSPQPYPAPLPPNRDPRDGALPLSTAVLPSGGAVESAPSHEEVPAYVPQSQSRDRQGRVAVVIDGPYFERCVVGHSQPLKGVAQYKKTTAALRETLAYLGDIFGMEPIGFWFDTSHEAFTDFLETGMPLHCREAAFREVALRREFLVGEMNSTGKLHNVVTRLVGSMKQQRGYTPDGPGHVWVQSGVDVALATCLVEHFTDPRHFFSQVVLLSGDSDIYPAVQYCNHLRRRQPLLDTSVGNCLTSEDSDKAEWPSADRQAGTFPTPPIRVCGTARSLSRPYGQDQDLFDFLPHILLNEPTHTERGKEFHFASHVVFE